MSTHASQCAERPRRSWSRFREVRPQYLRGGAAVTAGVILFGLGVWAALALGFGRMRPDYPLDQMIGLAQTPEISFRADADEWFLLEGEGWDPAEEQYGNVATGHEASCIYSWRTNQLGAGQIGTRLGETDNEASHVLLRTLAIDPRNASEVRVRDSNDASIALIFGSRQDGQISTAYAVRTFSGSNHMLIFQLICVGEGTATPALMDDALSHTTVELTRSE